MKQRSKGWTILSLFSVLTMLVLACSPSFAQETGPSGFQATPLTPESTIQIAKSAPGTSATKLISVIVKLQGRRSPRTPAISWGLRRPVHQLSVKPS